MRKSEPRLTLRQQRQCRRDRQDDGAPHVSREHRERAMFLGSWNGHAVRSGLLV